MLNYQINQTQRDPFNYIAKLRGTANQQILETILIKDRFGEMCGLLMV